MTEKLHHILLVEDNGTDVLLLRQALADAPFAHHLHVVEDGVGALAFLRRQPPYAAVPTPDLILLDINLPRCNGWEVLAQIKDSPEFTPIPVVVLTTSDNPDDVQRAYRQHANSYLIKPMAFQDYVRLAKALHLFWFDAATLPRS